MSVRYRDGGVILAYFCFLLYFSILLFLHTPVVPDLMIMSE